MGVATGVALMLKHTAVVLPLVIVAFAALWWVVKPWREGQSWAEWRGQFLGRLGVTVQSALVVVVTILLLTSRSTVHRSLRPWQRGRSATVPP